jgi:insulysin
MFSPIVNKHLEPKTSAKSPYPQLLLEHQLQKFYKIVPVRNLRDVTVVFPIPVTDDEKAYLTKSNRYWSHLIGHESEGSIFYSLKKKGWVNSLSSGQMSKFTGSFIFGVTISLTEEGEDHVEECIVALFQYLEYMRRMGPQKWIYDECKDLASVKFKYLEKTTPSDYVSGLASSLQKHRPEHIISGSYLWFEYDQEDIADFLKHMVPENMVILYQSQRFAGKTDQKERWYGIEYIKEDIEGSLLEKLSQIKLIDAELHLPVENPFIPRDLSLIKEEANNVTQHPVQIVEDQWCSVWYKKDEEFTQPRVNVYYKFIVAWTQTSPHYTIMSKLYNKMLLDNLNETLYFADLSDFEYHIQQNDTGFTVRLSGWNDKMSKMNTILFQRMVDASSIIRQDRFQILKERMIQNLKNKEKDQPYQHAIEEVSYVQIQNTFQNKELLEALQQCSFEHMTQYGRIWLNTLHFTLLIHGNYSLADAHSLVTETKKLFVLATTPVEPEKRIIKLESGKRYIRQITEPNAENKNSALEVLYRVGLRSPRTEALIDLLAQIMSNAFFNTLRTKEQIGYIVFCRVRHDHNVVSLGLLLQSSEKDPIYMLERCDVFIQNYFEIIKNLEESEFAKNVKSLIAKKLEKDKNLTQQTTHLFKEIVTKQYKFDRKEELVKEIEKLTRNDLIEFYQQNFLSDKTNQLIIEVFASGHEEFDKLRKEDENIVYIDNVHSFKHSMPMYPAFIKY